MTFKGAQERRFPSPLRYPGGKGKVANYVKLLFLENDLVGGEYAEPYAGGAAVALSLLFEEFAARVHINDVDPRVTTFWAAVLNDTDALCQRIADTPVTMDEWARQREVQLSNEPEPLDLAFSTFFLNRTNRSGILKGGVIGGQRQRGKWKLDARYNKGNLIKRVHKVARFESRIFLTQLDAAAFLDNVVPSLPDRSLLYLDPPYYLKGPGLYHAFYEPADHARIAEMMAQLDRPWIVSYDAVRPVMELYDQHRRIRYGLSYSAADRYRGGEVMFFSPGLRQPEVVSPARIKFKKVDRARMDRIRAA